MSIVDADFAQVRPASGPRMRRPRSSPDPATQLIDDLAALIDAGLIAVRADAAGPARYEAIAPSKESSTPLERCA